MGIGKTRQVMGTNHEITEAEIMFDDAI